MSIIFSHRLRLGGMERTFRSIFALVSFFGPIRFEADDWNGVSVRTLRERYSTLLEGEEVANALLHHTSIQNRCEDHRLVCRRPPPLADHQRQKLFRRNAMPDQYAMSCAASARAMPFSRRGAADVLALVRELRISLTRSDLGPARRVEDISPSRSSSRRRALKLSVLPRLPGVI
jgi:hypothetical protein